MRFASVRKVKYATRAILGFRYIWMGNQGGVVSLSTECKVLIVGVGHKNAMDLVGHSSI